MSHRWGILSLGMAFWMAMASAEEEGQHIEFGEGKYRNIPTGDTLELLKANGMQTMDFGIELLTDNLKVTSYREDKTIIPWEERTTKHLGLWENTWGEYEQKMVAQKMDMTDQQWFRKKHDTFFTEAFDSGYKVLHWKWMQEIYRMPLEYDIGDVPKEQQELKNTLKEAEKAVNEAELTLDLAGVPTDKLQVQLTKIECAVNQADAVSQYCVKILSFIEKEKKKQMSSLPSDITQVRDQLKSIADRHPHITTSWLTVVAGWSEVVNEWWEMYKDTLEKWEKIMKPYTEKTLFSDLAHFKGVDYAKLPDVPKKLKAEIEAVLAER